MVRNLGKGIPCRRYDGQRDHGNNADKRARRRRIAAYIAKHRNDPLSGWKRAVRRGELVV